MVFNLVKNKNDLLNRPISIKILNDKIDQVDHLKFLGVILDEILTWKKHIQYICTKIAKNIGIIAKARKILNTNILLMLYYCFIYPYINYICYYCMGHSQCGST